MAEPPQEKQPPPRRRWPTAIGADAGLAAAAFTRAGFADPALVLRWAEIVGAEVARLARPVKLAAGTLTLKAEPGASLFLAHESRALAQHINAWAGRPLVLRMKFLQGPLALPARPPQPPRPAGQLKKDDPAIAYRGPERLKFALESLARWRAADQERGD